MRTIVDIPDEQLDALAAHCERHKISRAEAVRKAVGRFLKDSEPVQSEVGFGIWKNKHLSSRKFVDKLRAEWREP